MNIQPEYMAPNMFMLPALCVLVTSVFAAAPPAPPAPSWPQYFITNWTLYNVLDPNAQPPYPDNPLNIPPAPYNAGRGATFYDWSIQSMREQYYDFCVPIFTEGNNWRCDFLNTKNISYLIAYDDRPAWVEPCCIFAEPWEPPGPTFISYSGLEYNGTTVVENQIVDWWAMPGPAPGPFGYGFFRNVHVNAYQVPHSFYFLGVPGFAAQNFFNWVPQQPSADTWTIPKECLNAKLCNYD